MHMGARRMYALAGRSDGRLGRIGRAVLVVHLLLSPLVFWYDTVEPVQYPKAALMFVTAVTLAAIGLVAALRQLPVTAEVVSRTLLSPWQWWRRDPISVGLLLSLCRGWLLPRRR